MDWFDSLIVLVCVYEFANVYICLGVSVYVLAHALICVCVCVCVCVFLKGNTTGVGTEE